VPLPLFLGLRGSPTIRGGVERLPNHDRPAAACLLQPPGAKDPAHRLNVHPDLSRHPRGRPSLSEQPRQAAIPFRGRRHRHGHIQRTALHVLLDATEQRKTAGAGKARCPGARGQRRRRSEQLGHVAGVKAHALGNTGRGVSLSVIRIRLPPSARRRRLDHRDIDLPSTDQPLEFGQQRRRQDRRGILWALSWRCVHRASLLPSGAPSCRGPGIGTYRRKRCPPWWWLTQPKNGAHLIIDVSAQGAQAPFCPGVQDVLSVKWGDSAVIDDEIIHLLVFAMA